MRLRLSILMFLQYAVTGSWVPLFTLILTERGFTPAATAWACATVALGALLAPLPWGQIADRWLPAQYCISICAFLCGVLLWVLAELTAPWPVFLATLGFWLFMTPALSLGTALAFRHLPAPERQFGPVRLWGTVGWIAPNLFLGCWFADPEFLCACLAYIRPSRAASELADAFRLGGTLAFILSLFALTLPNTPPSPTRPGVAKAHARRWLWSAFEAPLLTLRLFRQRAFLVFCVCLMGLYMAFPCSTQLTPLLLRDLGVPRAWLPATLTIAQASEVAALGLLPLVLRRLGVKATLFLGMAAWTIALTVLAIGEPAWLVIASLGLHGIFISCFLVAGQVFVNQRARQDIRTSAQALLQFLSGVGLLAGNLLVGWVRSLDGERFASTFALAACLAGTLCVVFLLGFRTQSD
jgi:MFS family permease